uniref:Collectrin-like domain-containing protein n=1 Tax=Nothobranchius furzeri TaxID=105023 RepID=A0A8C6P5G3_NOTFU
MRQHLKQEFSLSNILVCNETAPVSLWFVVTSPLDPTLLVDKEDVAAAVRKFRHRINCVFLLTDLTLEFVDLYPTLAEPAKLRLSVYLVVFLVMMSVIGAVMVVLFVSTVRELKCKKKQEADKGEEQQRVKKVENGVWSPTLPPAGHLGRQHISFIAKTWPFVQSSLKTTPLDPFSL